MADLNFIVAAFAVVWVGLAIYIFVLMQREKATRKEIESLKEALKKS